MVSSIKRFYFLILSIHLMDLNLDAPMLRKTPTASGTSTVALAKNTKGLNIQMLETHNQIQTIEKTVSKYRESLARNKNGDKVTVSAIRKKLEQAENTLTKLKRSESAIQNEKSSQKKKRDIF